MSRARSDFIKRIGDLSLTLQDDSVKDGALNDIAKNSIAKVLRNGLAVVLFSILEDFIRRRTSEVVSGIGASGVEFSALPEKLRKASTFDLISTASFRLKLMDESDRLDFLQDVASRISSTRDSPYSLSEYSIGWGKSNLGVDDVKDALSAFQIQDPWAAMQDIAGRLNFGSLPLRDAFFQASVRRHKAAHDAAAITLLPHLVDFVTQAKAIASSFDCLISKSNHFIKKHDPSYLSGQKIGPSHCRIRTILLKNGVWREHLEGRITVVSKSASRDTCLANATARALSDGDFLVVQGQSLMPSDWFFPAG